MVPKEQSLNQEKKKTYPLTHGEGGHVQLTPEISLHMPSAKRKRLRKKKEGKSRQYSFQREGGGGTGMRKISPSHTTEQERSGGGKYL